ncbi:MAG TPA: DUF3037 domain-containing protein [Parafilimonas sp.]|nr:DUF3037 domain-containing protein [Parafilimonas sp.]
MQDKHLFEYAIIRIVPRVEREEFLNAGVILYCADEKFLQSKCHINRNRLSNFSCEVEMEELEKKLEAIRQICDGNMKGGDIAALPIAARFRWLTAAKSTIIQTSAVHPGFCTNAKDELDKLFTELVE